MSKVEEAFMAATAAFQKVRAKNAKALAAAEEKLHAARIAWRAERDRIQAKETETKDVQ